jgi:hypothetical protein
MKLGACAIMVAAGIAFGASACFAQEQSEAADRGGAQQSERQPTLDDLLGLPQRPRQPDKPVAEPPAAADPAQAALERRLSAGEVSEQFVQAVELMEETAGRIKLSRDTGIQTQRLQDEIIRRLDMLIQSAEQQRQQSRSRASSSSQDQESQQQPAQPQAQQGQQQATDPDQAQTAPAGTDAQLNPEIASRGAAWGHLPDRVRDALLQGNADSYSSLYQRWTEAYYRRLAEEGNR